MTVPFAGGRNPDHAGGFAPREHSIAADIGRVKEARDFAAGAAADFGFDDDRCYEVRLAVSEAVTNAIKHGSSSPSDPVRIAITSEPGALIFEIYDTGRFVPRVVRGGSMARGGRGLEFMREMMDEVDLRPGQGGTRLRLSKRLQ